MNADGIIQPIKRGGVQRRELEGNSTCSMFGRYFMLTSILSVLFLESSRLRNEFWLIYDWFNSSSSLHLAIGSPTCYLASRWLAYTDFRI